MVSNELWAETVSDGDASVVDAPSLMRTTPARQTYIAANSVPVFESRGVTVYQSDCLSFMDELDAGSIDCIVTDPAYWTLNKWRNIGTTTRLGGNRDADKQSGWFETIDAQDLWEMLLSFGRILPKNGHAWVMCDGETLGYVLNYIREGDTHFNYVKPFPVIKKTNDGTGIKQGMGYHGRASHEYVVLCEKGRRRFNDENWPDVFEVPWTGAKESKQYTPDGKPFDTAKPVSLFRRLIELSSAEGETVFDPFAGSGTLGEAAILANRKCQLVDKSDRSMLTIRRRIEMAGGLFQ